MNLHSAAPAVPVDTSTFHPRRSNVAHAWGRHTIFSVLRDRTQGVHDPCPRVGLAMVASRSDNLMIVAAGADRAVRHVAFLVFLAYALGVSESWCLQSPVWISYQTKSPGLPIRNSKGPSGPANLLEVEERELLKLL